MKLELESALVRKINETYEEAQSEKNMAEGAMQRALLKARECGQYLLEARTMAGGGNWRSWLAQHVVQIHFNTAINYMRLTEISEEDLKNIHSKRQAYVFLGILEKVSGNANHINRDPDGTNWISILSSFTIKVEQLFDKRPLEEWQESDRQLFIERARPVVKRYVEAGGTL